MDFDKLLETASKHSRVDMIALLVDQANQEMKRARSSMGFALLFGGLLVLTQVLDIFGVIEANIVGTVPVAAFMVAGFVQAARAKILSLLYLMEAGNVTRA